MHVIRHQHIASDGGAHFYASLCEANERSVDFRTREQPIDDAIVRVCRATDQPVLATVDALHLEFLSSLDLILVTELGGEHDLTL